MMTEDKILWTAKYVEGDLTAEECLAFEAALSNDIELKAHLQEYQDISSSLKMKLSEPNQDLLDITSKLGQQYFTKIDEQPIVERRLKIIKIWWAAAAVFVVAMFIWAPWNNNLYEQYATRPEMSVAERGAEKTELDNAANLFNAKKYDDAKFVLAGLYKEDISNSLVAYYYGISLIETDELAKGRFVLAELSKGESVFKYEAIYEIALSYLKDGEKADCKFWLIKIPDGAAQYDKAQNLLKKL